MVPAAAVDPRRRSGDLEGQLLLLLHRPGVVAELGKRTHIPGPVPSNEESPLWDWSTVAAAASAAAAGYMAAVVAEAERLRVSVPELALGCASSWRRWARRLAGSGDE
jgi:hypothetical protein